MSIILSGLASLAGRFLGKHLLDNHLAKAGTGTLQSLIGGIGNRLFLGAGAMAYGLVPGVRHGIDAAAVALVHALKAATIG